MPNIFCYWIFCINAWPSSIRGYDLELDEAKSEVLCPGEHLRVQFLTRDNCDDHDNTAASHLARQTEQVELNRLTDVADLVSQCSIPGHHKWTWHEYYIKLCDTNPSIRSLNCSKLASEARNSSLSFSDWPGGYNHWLIDISTKISTKYPCLPVDGIL